MTRTTRIRRIWILIAGVAVLLVAAAVAGPKIYAALQPPAKAPLSVEEPASGAGSAPSSSAGATADPAFDPAGVWKVTEGSQAGYRVKEVLNGENVTVVGRTGNVRGEVTVAGNAITAGAVDLDVAGIATDSANRDAYFRDSVMNATANPRATFTLKTPVALPGLSAGSAKLSATGSLNLAGKSRDVPVELTLAHQADGTVAVSGTINIKATDFGLTPPSLGFVTVEDGVVVEFLVRLQK